MKTIKALVESDLPVEKVVEVTLPLTRRAKPEYKGNAHVQLRVDFARGNGWGGIATVNGREIKITGPYGVQKKVPGLIVPAGTGRGEWEWRERKAESLDDSDLLSLYRGVPATDNEVVTELAQIGTALDDLPDNDPTTHQLLAAQQALAWSVNSSLTKPSQMILRQTRD